jgi:hypothetical protein
MLILNCCSNFSENILGTRVDLDVLLSVKAQLKFATFISYTSSFLSSNSNLIRDLGISKMVVVTVRNHFFIFNITVQK